MLILYIYIYIYIDTCRPIYTYRCSDMYMYIYVFYSHCLSITQQTTYEGFGITSLSLSNYVVNFPVYPYHTLLIRQPTHAEFWMAWYKLIKTSWLLLNMLIFFTCIVRVFYSNCLSIRQRTHSEVWMVWNNLMKASLLLLIMLIFFDVSLPHFIH